ncbi:hypothetical protein SLA2020_013150 [Shorea laevis]
MTDSVPKFPSSLPLCGLTRPLQLNINTLLRSFSYRKLPQSPVRLSICKLDGSSFDVEVEIMAKVADLKEAVEQVFRESMQESQIDISWSHVWGNFCLCYKDGILIDDKALICFLGIKDGDQLHFIRHLSPKPKF